MDFNPDEAIAAGWLRADSAPARILEKLSRFSLRQAESIIALDRFMRDRIVNKNIAPEKIAVIPPWSHDDEVRFDPVGRKQFRKAHGLEGKFVVMYSGKYQRFQDLVGQYAALLIAQTRAERDAGAKKDRAPEILLAQDSEIQQLMAHFQGQIPHGQQSDLP